MTAFECFLLVPIWYACAIYIGDKNPLVANDIELFFTAPAFMFAVAGIAILVLP